MNTKPKRKYTVSEKVRAANRHNLEKANAVPKAVRYRSTPQRATACRQNLQKALAARKPAAPPPHRPWSCRRLLAGARRWGREACEELKARRERVAYIVDPDTEEQVKLARGMAEGLGRWLSLLRDRMERERKALLRIWAAAPRDGRAAARLGGRLLGLFQDEAWMEQTFVRLDWRLLRLGRMFFEMRSIPLRPLREAMEEVSAEALGNPFAPMPSPKMAALLARPLPELHFGDHPGHRVLPGLPAEEPWREAEEPSRADAERELCGAKERRAGACPGLADPRIDPTGGRAQPPSSDAEWPEDFEAYHALVQQCLGAPEELAPLVERIARLSWERQEAVRREWERALAALDGALRRCWRHMASDAMMDAVLNELAGDAWQEAQAQAGKLEEELAEAFGEYLDRQYDAPPQSDPATGGLAQSVSSAAPGNVGPTLGSASG